MGPSFIALTVGLAACGGGDAPEATAPSAGEPTAVAETGAAPAPAEAVINPENWPKVETPALNPVVERRVDELLSKLTLEQKVGQVIQADSSDITPEEVKKYRLGSVLSGGNSAPGPLPYADTATWLAAADAYWEASVDGEGVEVAIPIMWGIDAVHGHANLRGATVFPHNIGLGAANNPDLIEEIAAVTARELTVSGHDWTFAPTLAVPQDDRWGRTYEGFSEDPSIVASYGDRIVIGLQGRFGSDEFMGDGHVISSAKHFLGDGGTKDGIDQGDAIISEEELRDIHNAGYVTSVQAGVQTVMASFSAWQGQRMHGQKELLTDVLKGRMDFKGFVIGDWNGHALIPGCTSEDCPQSLNAGLDMYMAPDSWRYLYESTLRHVQEGTIPMERLDDAVRRILRVKVQSGIMDKPRPSERPNAGDESVLASAEHREVARRAVRESLVLMKNENQTLPLDASKTILVVGDGADSISKVSGGWTLSWQGGGYPNSEFPNGQSILDAMEEAVEAAGGELIFSADGSYDGEADAVVAIYGEDPYAEFQGDRQDVDFEPNGFDTGLLQTYRDRGLPVVSVFLSGRPLWTNPEMNDSSAFVAAWLPGSEGGGVSDMIFRSDDSFEFTGRLSYSWPALATQTTVNVGGDETPLFPVGYGLSYGDSAEPVILSEESGLTDAATAAKGEFFVRGEFRQPWQLYRDGTPVDAVPFSDDVVAARTVDGEAQEDSLAFRFSGAGDVAIGSGYGHDFSRESNGALELVFRARILSGPEDVTVGMGCHQDDCTAFGTMTLDEEWSEYRMALSCFAGDGVDMTSFNRALIIRGAEGQEVAVGNVRLTSDDDGQADCPAGLGD
ncbi:1,4-beta-D-glucan glucohydrolase [Parvularcula sp. ZS-1/3]|uniref:1,4-beta-D-glucan glucohydrolase n=2 Tax=Parvularcula mediterranea TaxID=2732508 RepID=A0A7Y3RJZ7_9PROT|nr:1,4-beta-D-glucan glucohydrolase [Parvularcula mediterranea]